MTRRLVHWTRVARTGLCFLIYAVGGTALGLVVPAVHWLPGSESEAELRAQRLTHRACRFFIGTMKALGLLRVTRIGTERLARERPLLLVANHPSLIDATLLCSFMPQADFLAKPKWADNLMIRGIARAAGHPRIDSGPAALEECAAHLRGGRSLLIFPEGTRTPVEGLLPFHRGAAHIALETGMDLTPVVISVSPRALMRGQRWYDIPEEPLQYTVRVEGSISPKEFMESGATRSIAARHLTAALRESFLKRLDRAES